MCFSRIQLLNTVWNLALQFETGAHTHTYTHTPRLSQLTFSFSFLLQEPDPVKTNFSGRAELWRDNSHLLPEKLAFVDMRSCMKRGYSLQRLSAGGRGGCYSHSFQSPPFRDGWIPGINVWSVILERYRWLPFCIQCLRFSSEILCRSKFL